MSESVSGLRETGLGPMRGTVVGPGKTEGKVTVKFEGAAGSWAMWPHEISLTKDMVCSSGRSKFYMSLYYMYNVHTVLMDSLCEQIFVLADNICFFVCSLTCWFPK